MVSSPLHWRFFGTLCLRMTHWSRKRCVTKCIHWSTWEGGGGGWEAGFIKGIILLYRFLLTFLLNQDTADWSWSAWLSRYSRAFLHLYHNRLPSHRHAHTHAHKHTHTTYLLARPTRNLTPWYVRFVSADAALPVMVSEEFKLKALWVTLGRLTNVTP